MVAGAQDEHRGYSFFTSLGSLSDTSYSADGKDYAVKLLVLTGGKLYLGQSEELTAGLALWIDQVEFVSGDALLSQPGAAHLAHWPAGSLNWSEGDRVEVSLVAAEGEEAPTQLVNSPATGAPTISGTAQVGHNLMASTSGITDDNGLEDAEFRHQWVADDADIPGATAPTYTLTVDDVGKMIKVMVSFTDDEDFQETLTSAATDAVAATLPDAPEHLRVAPHDAQGLDVSWGAPASDGGSAVTGYKVQWKEATGDWDTPADVSEEAATGNAHTIGGLTDGVAYAVRVIATNARGDGPASAEETGTPRETTRPELSHEPTVYGTTMQLVYTEALDETSVPAASSFLLRVVGSDDPFTWHDERAIRAVEGATVKGSRVILTLESPVAVGDYVVIGYTAPSDEAAPRIRDLAGNAAYGFNAIQVGIGTEAAENNPATGVPTISGTAQVGQTLTASTSGILDSDGLDNVSYSYQWVRNDGNADSDIAGASGPTYKLAEADQGKTIKVRVSFTDDRNNSESLTSAATSAVSARSNNPATGAPTISGTVQAGQILTAGTTGIDDADGLDDVSYSYQWIRNDGTRDSNIQDANASTYTLSDDDVGKTVKVRVSFTDDRDNRESLTSAATSAVTTRLNSAATGLPTISGTVQVGQTLTVSTSDINDADGLDDVSYSYQWIRSDGNTDSDIAGATGSAYELAVADQGKTIKVKVSFEDDQGNSESLTSAATDAVAARLNTAATGAPTISGTVKAGETLTASTSGIARRGRVGQRFLQLPVAGRRYRHLGRDRLHLHADQRRGGQYHQGQGLVHRRLEQPGVPDQHGHRGRGGQAGPDRRFREHACLSRRLGPLHLRAALQ